MTPERLGLLWGITVFSGAGARLLSVLTGLPEGNLMLIWRCYSHSKSTLGSHWHSLRCWFAAVISTPNRESNLAKTIFIKNSDSDLWFKAKKVTFHWFFEKVQKVIFGTHFGVEIITPNAGSNTKHQFSIFAKPML